MDTQGLTILPRPMVWLLDLLALWHEPVYEKRSSLAFTRVFRMAWSGHRLAIKVIECSDPSARALLFREHMFLRTLRSPHVASYRGHLVRGHRYVLVTDWIEGFCLEDNGHLLRAVLSTRAGFALFTHECTGIVDLLRNAGIRHRDLREKNIIVSDAMPVLFDFGWAVWHDEVDAFTPSALPKALMDDATAMAAVLGRLQADRREQMV